MDDVQGQWRARFENHAEPTPESFRRPMDSLEGLAHLAPESDSHRQALRAHFYSAATLGFQTSRLPNVMTFQKDGLWAPWTAFFQTMSCTELQLRSRRETAMTKQWVMAPVSCCGRVVITLGVTLTILGALAIGNLARSSACS